MMLKGGTGLVYLSDDAFSAIQVDPDIQSITQMFIGLATKERVSVLDDESSESSTSAFTIVTGIEQASFQEMKPWIKFKEGPGFDGGRWFQEVHQSAKNEIVMGFEVAEYENRKVGDSYYLTITPHGQTQPILHEFKIVGILDRTGTQDDGAVYLPIQQAQQLFNRPGQLTIIGIKLKEFNGIRMREFEGRWMKLPEVQVVSLQQVKGALISLVGTAQIMITAVAVIAIIIAIIGVVNTVLMSVFERMGEIGIMKAIGASRQQIFLLIWIETFCLALMGALAGSFIALLVPDYVDIMLRQLLNMGINTSLVAITMPIVLQAILAAILLGLLAGIWPAWRAANMAPVAAIRSNE